MFVVSLTSQEISRAIDRQKGSRMRSNLVAAVLAAMTPGMAAATEGGGSYQTLGLNTIMPGFMAPPGLSGNVFIQHYDANRTVDGSGTDRPGIHNFNVYFNSVTMRLYTVWNDVALWGANIETRVVFGTYVDAHVSFDLNTPGGTVHRQGSAHGNGDVLFVPVALGWHGEQFHQIAGAGVFLPTGSFDKTQLANAGRGHYSFAPSYAVTWLPSDSYEGSLNLAYLFNGTNHNTGYRSGNELAIDYTLGYVPTPSWQLGLAGYGYRQTTDDMLNGQSVPGGNRGQVFAMGPFLRYHDGGKWGVTFKWQYETWAENRPEGNRFFVQLFAKLQ